MDMEANARKPTRRVELKRSKTPGFFRAREERPASSSALSLRFPALTRETALPGVAWNHPVSRTIAHQTRTKPALHVQRR